MFDLCSQQHKKDNSIFLDRAVDVLNVDLCTVMKVDSHSAQQMVRVGVADDVKQAGEARDHGGVRAGDVQDQVQDCDDDE